MKNKIITSLTKPPLYTKTAVEFWNDEYISKQMLKAHLNPEFEAASRKLAFIEKSASWIKELVPPCDYPTLLDIGCGPGIYAELFHQMGYQVTGLDFSERSIQYAQQSSLNQSYDITYLYQDYLKMDLKKQFDLITMIYCDYGALSTEDRQLILNKVYQHLKEGGKFLFDVFTMKKYRDFHECQTWNYCEHGGFWRADEYVEVNGSYQYPDNVTLNLTSIISDSQITPYYIWDTYFTKDSLIQEVKQAGFKVCDVFGDVTGKCFDEDSETMAILVEK